MQFKRLFLSSVRRNQLCKQKLTRHLMLKANLQFQFEIKNFQKQTKKSVIHKSNFE